MFAEWVYWIAIGILVVLVLILSIAILRHGSREFASEKLASCVADSFTILSRQFRVLRGQEVKLRMMGLSEEIPLYELLVAREKALQFEYLHVCENAFDYSQRSLQEISKDLSDPRQWRYYWDQIRLVTDQAYLLTGAIKAHLEVVEEAMDYHTVKNSALAESVEEPPAAPRWVAAGVD